MANYTQFEVVDPSLNAYRFKDEETGEDLLALGPEAEALAQQIKMRTPDLRVAGPGAPGPAPATFGEDTEANPPVLDMDAEEAKMKAERPANPLDEIKSGKAEVMGTRKEGGKTITTYKTSAGLRDYARTPGSPGTTSKQLEEEDKAARLQRIGARETLEGGYDPDEQYIEQLYRHSQDERIAAGDIAEAQQRKAEADRVLAATNAARLQQEADETQQKRGELETRMEGERVAYDSAIEAVRGKKVDANRLFSGSAGTARLLGVAIAHGFASYASAKLGRPDTFQQMIDGAINRDIAEQEHEIMQGNKNVDNALVRLTKSTGSLEQAKILLRQLQQEVAVEQAREIAGRAQSDEIAAKLAMFETNSEMEREAKREEYMRLAAGKHTSQVEGKFARPKRATGPTETLTGTDFGVQGKIADLNKAGVGIKKTEAEVRETDARTRKTDAEATRTQKGSAELAKVAAAKQTFSDAMSALGLTVDDKGNANMPDKFDALPNYGPADNWLKLPWSEKNKVMAHLKSSANQAYRAATGAAGNEQEFEREWDDAVGDGSEEALRQGMQRFWRRLEVKENVLKSGDTTLFEPELPEPDPVN